AHWDFGWHPGAARSARARLGKVDMILAHVYCWSRKQVMRTIAILSGIVLASISLEAATTTLAPVADTTLQSAFPGNNIGGESSLWAGGRRQGGAARSL